MTDIFKRVPRAVWLLSIAIAAFAIGACDSNSSPAAPSSGAGFSNLPGSFLGATVQGTVLGNRQSAVRTATDHEGCDDLTVEVVGTMPLLSVEVGCDGEFVLTDVPEGEVTLRFVGPGLDVTKSVGPIAVGETMELEVSIIAVSSTENDVQVDSVTVTGDDNSSDDDSASDDESADDKSADDDSADDDSAEDKSADDDSSDDDSADDDSADDESTDDESADDESADDDSSDDD